MVQTKVAIDMKELGGVVGFSLLITVIQVIIALTKVVIISLVRFKQTKSVNDSDDSYIAMTSSVEPDQRKYYIYYIHILYYIILYYIILYYIILYWIILYYIILYCIR